MFPCTCSPVRFFAWHGNAETLLRAAIRRSQYPRQPLRRRKSALLGEAASFDRTTAEKARSRSRERCARTNASQLSARRPLYTINSRRSRPCPPASCLCSSTTARPYRPRAYRHSFAPLAPCSRALHLLPVLTSHSHHEVHLRCHCSRPCRRLRSGFRDQRPAYGPWSPPPPPTHPPWRFSYPA